MMNLVDYEQSKFELAALLRSAETRLHAREPRIHAPFHDLFARMAEDRFNLVVVGRFSRGKSSLMNAMLHTDRLPVGLVPVTSVITTVSYGSTEKALVEYQDTPTAFEIPFNQLPDYITQTGNPGNERRVALARIELPAELLRRGFHFVDTPGLGSAIVANTRTTERFLPQADAFMLVTSFDSPLSEEEMRTLRRIAVLSAPLFIVVNKSDLATGAEQQQVLAHIATQTREIFGESIPRLFPVSAQEALTGHRLLDERRAAASGVSELFDEVARFMLTRKQRQWLVSLCDRVAQALTQAPYNQGDVEHLQTLRRRLTGDPSDRVCTAASTLPEPQRGTRFHSCAVCERMDRGMYDFLCHYQYELATDTPTQQRLARTGGWCAFHTWQYAAISSAQGTCLGLWPTIEQWSSRLDELARLPELTRATQLDIVSLRNPNACSLCCKQTDLETQAVREFREAIVQAGPAAVSQIEVLCIPHCVQLVTSSHGEEVVRRWAAQAASALKRLAEDMQRYSLKRDGIRRGLASEEEETADRRAMMVLGGHRNVFGLRPYRS